MRNWGIVRDRTGKDSNPGLPFRCLFRGAPVFLLKIFLSLFLLFLSCFPYLPPLHNSLSALPSSLSFLLIIFDILPHIFSLRNMLQIKMWLYDVCLWKQWWKRGSWHDDHITYSYCFGAISSVGMETSITLHVPWDFWTVQ